MVSSTLIVLCLSLFFETEFPSVPSISIERWTELLVEVHFEVHHWHVSGYDSFQAKAERIDILRDSAFKFHQSTTSTRPKMISQHKRNKKLPK
ncbi:hypothetical protein BDR07DRAFT_1401286 [Suillus spraguei]|nr:hypothetical protein BDR07DRAFT_1401286 [Suillus spraguei]